MCGQTPREDSITEEVWNTVECKNNLVIGDTLRLTRDFKREISLCGLRVYGLSLIDDLFVDDEAQINELEAFSIFLTNEIEDKDQEI